MLVYSTCTILPEENEQVTDAFLAEHSEFCREGFTLPEPVGETEGQLTLWPQRHGTDGFYICRMKRKHNEDDMIDLKSHDPGRDDGDPEGDGGTGLPGQAGLYLAP